MWQRITHAIRPKGHDDHDAVEPPAGPVDPLCRPTTPSSFLGPSHSTTSLVYRDENAHSQSPSKRSKRAHMKRLSKTPNSELPAPSPAMKFPTMPKKMKSALSLKAHDAEASRRSHDTTRPSEDTVRTTSGSIIGGSLKLTNRRASLDMLRSPERSRPELPPINTSAGRPSYDSLRRPTTPGPDANFGSTRSILRDPNTPGTGQNVRFFSRDAYKVISPNTSLDPPMFPNAPGDLANNPVDRDTPSDAIRISPTSPKIRPKLSDVFGHASSEPSCSQKSSSDVINPFEISGGLDLPPFPPGLGFEVDEPLMEPDVVFQQTLDAAESKQPEAPMSSTPFRPERSEKSVGKARESIRPPSQADEGIFHLGEDSLPLQDKAIEDSFSVAQAQQTAFYSMDYSHPKAAKRSSGTSSSLISGQSIMSSMSGDKAPQDSDTSFSSSRHTKNRSKVLTETMFHSMLRSRDNSRDFAEPAPMDVVESSMPHGPTADPFSAHANAYYTPQSRLPGTPPKMTHSRGNSKEENIILSLQTQLAIQTEICGQFEADLRAKEELVAIMEKKIAVAEREDGKRKAAVKSWRKKVIELEKAVRYLEDEVEHSRHESLERSVMDEASSEALRMLHRQISSLEKEKVDWQRAEEALREDVHVLESHVAEKTNEVQRLNEQLWKNSESEQRLRDGIQEAQAQMEMLGNVSLVVDSESPRASLHQKSDVSEQLRIQQLTWENEKLELETRNEGVLVERARIEEELAAARTQCQTLEQDVLMLKAELEAQWQHTAESSRKMDALRAEKDTLEAESDRLRSSAEELEGQLTSLERDRKESEERHAQFEAELEELWKAKDAVDKGKAEQDDALHAARVEVDDLWQKTREQETRTNTLLHEKEYSSATIARLEESLRRISGEVSHATEHARQREQEVEELKEQMHAMSREYDRLSAEHERALNAASSQDNDTQMRLQLVLTEKAEVDIEAQSHKELAAALKDEGERLRRQIQELQQESSAREVKVVQLMKQHDKDREDIQGMNIALDSKQQELELMKRRFGVKGTAGATPAKLLRSVAQPRESSAFVTPTVPRNRPPSVISDSGRESVASIRESSSKASSALRGSRVSNISGGSSARSSMGPPSKMAGSSTKVAKPLLSRSASAKPTPVESPSSLPHRRASSTTALQQLKTPATKPISSQQGTKEKENQTRPIPS